MMKGPKNKTILKSLLVIGIMLILFSPVYMYFSHDVLRLKTEYPHLKILTDGSAEIELKRQRPKNWVGLKEISIYGKWAIILSEDWAFYQHQGLDVKQIKAALEEMVAISRFRGASTITQQMVKNVYLSNAPTLWRKLHEIILSQKIEKVLNKDRILEIYFNCIEYGPGIYGIKSASIHYFKKAPSQLTPREAAFLAMLLPSPKRYYVNFKNKKLSRFAQSRVKAVLQKLRMAKVISPVQYQEQDARKMSWER